ncbi:hypothetical protein TW85_13135 [Marinomonas sp. S3726]|uniref:hypothetical protein n=1 Tax=Marinomonas sp. S3726 TaxID=579484 RepID=UPI0005FA5F22|nr:hypothetical protein [Marinomonas sp. S3726]KJZ13633.1 hypothetical protein TW85_13135 [Marinomonas sp. S3726]
MKISKVLLLSFLMSLCSLSYASNDNCIELVEKKEILSEVDLRLFSTSIKKIKEGKLLYRNNLGFCSPTNDTYLVGYKNDKIPRILTVIKGHTPEIKVYSIKGEKIMMVYYFSGGNQYSLKPFLFKNNQLDSLSGFSVSSNIRKIEIVNDELHVKNQELMSDGSTTIINESYKYDNGKFHLVPHKI